jgi:hypothetical protein
MDYDEKLLEELNHSFFCECLEEHDLWKRTEVIQVETI